MESRNTTLAISDTFCKLKQEALKAGLIINNNKTKYLHCTRRTIHPTHTNIGKEQFEQVNSFKYLGAMVNIDSSIEEEIKERIAAGNRAYHVHKKKYLHQNIPKPQTTTLQHVNSPNSNLHLRNVGT